MKDKKIESQLIDSRCVCVPWETDLRESWIFRPETVIHVAVIVGMTHDKKFVLACPAATALLANCTLVSSSLMRDDWFFRGKNKTHDHQKFFLLLCAIPSAWWRDEIEVYCHLFYQIVPLPWRCSIVVIVSSGLLTTVRVHAIGLKWVNQMQMITWALPEIFLFIYLEESTRSLVQQIYLSGTSIFSIFF